MSSQPKYQQEATIYKKPADIFGVLKTLMRARQLITIKFKGLKETFNTMVLKVDLEGQYFILDEFALAIAHKHATSKDSFSGRASFHGVVVTFKNAKVSAAGTWKGTAIYKVAFPEQMTYLQRRGAFRVQVSRSHNVRVTIKSDAHENNLIGTLTDISGTGCQVAIPGVISPALTEGEMCDTCYIDLPDEPTIECAIEARHTKYVEASNTSFVGVHLHDLQGMDQRHLDRFINNLQRELKKLETKE